MEGKKTKASLALVLWGLVLTLMVSSSNWSCVQARPAGAPPARPRFVAKLPLFHRHALHSSKHLLASGHSHAAGVFYTEKTPATDIIRGEDSGDYFTVIGVGTPVQYMHFMLDMASDLTWMQCEPCIRCYDQQDPIFDQISTIRSVPCMETGPICSSLPGNSCLNDLCYYSAKYGDGTTTEGHLKVAPLLFGAEPDSSLELTNVLIGCSDNSQSTSLSGIAAGILAMGAGHYSLPSKRLASFTYCLPSLFSPTPGFLTLDDNPGSGAAGIGGATISFPFTTNIFHPSYYYVPMSAISVAHSILDIPTTSFIVTADARGGVILNAGISISQLDPIAYSALSAAFRASMSGRFNPVMGGAGGLQTCYTLPNGPDTQGIPLVQLHFDGGAVISLSSRNVLMDMGDGTHCLAFQAAPALQKSVLGARLQQGFQVTFDLDTRLVHFAPNAC